MLSTGKMVLDSFALHIDDNLVMVLEDGNHSWMQIYQGVRGIQSNSVGLCVGIVCRRGGTLETR